MDDLPSNADTRLAIDGGRKLRSDPFGPRWVFDEDDRRQLESVLARAPKAWRNGEKIREFVAAFESTFGARNAVATGSGTSAIHAAAGALDLKPGDEVITTPATDIGTVVGLLQHNLTPVFADWAEGTFNTCPADIERRITDRTRAILVVHLFGFPCDMDPILDLSARHGLAVIEDCAQAHLAEHKGRKVGTFGDLACWSFGLKTLTTEQGGMVSARDADLAARARGFLSKGSVKQDGSWIPYSRLGTFAPMTDLQAAVGMAQISRLEDATRRRETVAGYLDEAIAGIGALTVPARAERDRNVYYMYPYHFDEAAAGVAIGRFIEALRAEGISDAFGPYLKGRPLHRQKLFQNLDTYGGSGFPLKDDMGVVRVDYASLRLPRIEALLPGLGFFHMRNSFTEADGRDIAAAVVKVARGLGFGPGRLVEARRQDAAPVSPSMLEPAPSCEKQPSHDRSLNRPTEPAGDATQGLRVTEKPVVVELSTAQSAGRDNARRLQAAIDLLSGKGGRIQLPAGRFVLEPVRLVRRRNLVIEGAGGNLVDGGTRLEFETREDSPGLDLRTVVHCRIESLALLARGPGAAVSICCDETGSDGTSSLSLSFSRCSFSANEDHVAVALRDCAGVSFEHCWFNGPGDAVWLGAAERSDAKSISNGLVNSIRFDTCLFFAPSRVVRASCASWSCCHFSTPGGRAVALIDAGEDHCSEASALSVRDGFALEGGAATFFRGGGHCSGLIFEGCRLRGFDYPLSLAGVSGAVIRGNVFEGHKSILAPQGAGQKEAVICQANVERFQSPSATQ